MKKPDHLPFNKPFIVGKELYYIAQAVMMESHISGDGPFTKRCQKWLEDKLEIPRALLTHSCTAALEMAAILCDIQPGDEVIMPSFTFVSTANAFVLRGGVPVFVDIRPDTLNLNEALVENAVTEKTKVIVPVHYAGMPCAMDKIMEIADKYKLIIVEDAAQAYLSKYKNKFLGAIGHLGCLSFHETKNIISGEGGSLLINDKRFLGRAEIIWEKGTDRSKFLRGEIDKYSWNDIGSSFMPSDMISAFLFAQLEQAQKIVAKRSALFIHYYNELKCLEEKGHLKLPCLLERSSGNGHIFYIMAKSCDEGRQLQKYLRKQNIDAIFHYVPLHSSQGGKKWGKISGDMNVTEEISGKVLRLPLYFGLEMEGVNQVVEAIKEFYNGSKKSTPD